jgi:hypothetical protein
MKENGSFAATVIERPGSVPADTGNPAKPLRTRHGETFGMLCFAEISAFGDLPPLEIQEVRLFDRLPENWTYPQIQPCLFRKIRETVGISD